MIHFFLLSIMQFLNPQISFPYESSTQVVNSQSPQFFKKDWFNVEEVLENYHDSPFTFD
jgi:hypothetical protein